MSINYKKWNLIGFLVLIMKKKFKHFAIRIMIENKK